MRWVPVAAVFRNSRGNMHRSSKSGGHIRGGGGPRICSFRRDRSKAAAAAAATTA